LDVFPELIHGPLRDAAVAAAHELGLFEALPRPASELADRLQVRPRRLAALVRVLLLDGALVESHGILRPPAVPVPARPPSTRGAWGRLAGVIRSDRPLATDSAPAAQADELRRFHDHLRSAGASAAQEVAQLLDPEGPLLDLGGGAGAYTAAFLAAHPLERATIVDRPTVLELAREAVPAAGRSAADLLGDDPWPAEVRIALLANVLHLYGPADAARLVARAARSVVGGGQVAVKDFDASSPTGILFSLNMALFTDAGEVHDAMRLCAFLRAAGLRNVTTDRLRSAPEALLVRGRVA
jgi:hypothetical protein